MNSRQQTILQIVVDRGRVSVATLAKTIGVSEVTIRHDLNRLNQCGYLTRIHGYAIALESDDVEARIMSNYALKYQLAKFAASLVDDGETVFVENGSSNALLARMLATQKTITLVTVSSYIAHQLRDTNAEVILLGGFYQKKSQSLVGPMTRHYIQQVHFNKAFIGIDGFSASTGFTGRDMMRADVINAILEKGSENIILTDSSKFNVVHPYTLGPISHFNRVITDEGLDIRTFNQLQKNIPHIDIVKTYPLT